MKRYYTNNDSMEHPDEIANTPINRLINRDQLISQGKLPRRITSRNR